MTSRPPQDILQELENDVTDRHFDRAGVLNGAAAAYEDAGDDEKAGYLRVEAAAFSLSTRRREKAFPGYYQPWFVSSEGQTVPNKTFFDDDTLGYLAERARVVPNSIHAARFADVVWDLANRKDPAMAKPLSSRFLHCTASYPVGRPSPSGSSVAAVGARTASDTLGNSIQ